MSDMKKHVDHMFRKYPSTKKNMELREEMIANLEARKADLVAGGMKESEAAALAKSSLQSVEGLIDGNRPVYIVPWLTETLQWLLIYLLIAWILIIPFELVNVGGTVSLLLIESLAAAFIVYAVLYIIRRKSPAAKVTYIYEPAAARWVKLAWGIWGLCMVVQAAVLTAALFGSNIWFRRPITFEGPYLFALSAAQYAAPFASVVIPLIISKGFRLLKKYEAASYEN